MKKIPLLDLKSQYKTIRKDINTAIQVVLDKQIFIMGDEVRRLEERVARFCGTKYGVGVNSGTDALILALKAFGVKEKDEVITTPFTFVATAEAIVHAGAKTVFVDIDPLTYNINPELIERKINRKTKAILPVHLYGLCAGMSQIMRIAKKYGLKVLEDCAQAIGSTYHGKKAGSIGNVGALSFFPSKNLGGFGDGGMVVTSNKHIADRVRLLRGHGSGKRYIHGIIGYNSRLDDLQAAVLNVKIRKLDKWLNARIKNAKYFNNSLKKYPLKLPVIPNGMKHTFHLYKMRTPLAAGLIDFLTKNDIDSRAYYPVPLHLQKCFKYLGYKHGDFPEAEKASKEVLNIPVYPELTEKEKKYIVGKIKQFFSQEKRIRAGVLS